MLLSRLRDLAESAIVVAALGFTAVDGNAEAFSSAVERATPFDGARRVCQSVRALTAQSHAEEDRLRLAEPETNGPVIFHIDEIVGIKGIDLGLLRI